MASVNREGCSIAKDKGILNGCYCSCLSVGNGRQWKRISDVGSKSWLSVNEWMRDGVVGMVMVRGLGGL